MTRTAIRSLLQPSIVAGILLATALAGSAHAQAGTQTVTGKRLLIKNAMNGNKIVFRSQQGTMALAGSAGDPTSAGTGGGGGSIRIVGNDEVTVALPAANWSNVGFYKYKDPSGATCRVVIVKGGRLKAVCNGPAVTYRLGTAEMSVNVVLSTGTGPMDYCATFGGNVVGDGADGKTFVAKDAPTGTCPGPPHACGDSAFPTCGGSCPAGETCQPTASTSAVCPVPGPPGVTTSGCQCFPFSQSCTFELVPANGAGFCQLIPDGSCPPGRACAAFTGTGCGGCLKSCCILPGEACTPNPPTPSAYGDFCCDGDGVWDGVSPAGLLACPASGVCPP